ncbi:MAG: monoheme cytochrome C, partial [Flavobacteriales bacterium]|nr:monoheme cytochrome C [Flavobacteriales bacterium]
LPEFENGTHLETGFKEGDNLQLVIANCTGCHSSKMVTQNRATREGWKSMIRWMQETQNLWELGEGEDLILDYLAKYYAPEKKGRRQPLTDINWYELED